MPGVLDGIKVLDFSRALNGPLCGVWLSDYGAEVIKVEPQRTGDLSRLGYPVPNSDFTVLAICGSRGKKSITLDLKKEKAREVIYKLVERCDIIISNFLIGTMERLGLGYEDVRKRNPRIIYGRASGYGARGPMATVPLNDFAVQAYGGLVSVTGAPEEPGIVSASIADLGGALCFTLGIILAVVARERFGIGQRVDTSLFGATLMLQAFELDHYCMSKLPDPLRVKRYHNLHNAAYGLHPTKDGWIMAHSLGRGFDSYCKALGVPELIGDPRFDPSVGNREDQIKYREEMGIILDKACRKKTTQEWMELLPITAQANPVRTYEDIVHDPKEQALENGYLIEMDLPGLGPTKIAGDPAMLSETPAKAQGLPSQMGQHTEEVLLELGYSWDDIAEMREQEVI